MTIGLQNESEKPLYVASWSGGKDSTATIILAHEKGEPLDLIIFSEVMFDKDTSGELPEHIEFIHRCKKTFEEWGYPVKILRSDKTYMDAFNHIVQRSKIPERNGKRQGFPLSGKCFVNGVCKLKPIRKFEKEHPNAIHYVGIAIDEPKRLERLNDKTISLLAKYGYTEADAYELCEIYDMLSPVYQYANRGGCWFCPNAKDGELRHLRDHHRELWNRLLALEEEEDIVRPVWGAFGKVTLHEKEREFALAENQVRWEL